MATSKTWSKKAPSQNPTKFYEGDQQGGRDGSPTKVPDRLASATQREKVYGRDTLKKQ